VSSSEDRAVLDGPTGTPSRTRGQSRQLVQVPETCSVGVDPLVQRCPYHQVDAAARESISTRIPG